MACTVSSCILLRHSFKKYFLQLGLSPLLAACAGGHTETAQLLIDKGASVNMYDKVMKVCV